MSATLTPQPAAPASTAAEIINTWGRVAVSIVVVAAFLVAQALSLFKSLPDSAQTSTLLATLNTLATTVVAYWVGSSAGSTAKDAKIPNVAAPAPGTTTTTTTP